MKEKIPSTTKTEEVQVMMAEASNDGQIIKLKCVNKEGKVTVCEVPLEALGALNGKNPKEWAEKLARTFNGYKEASDGSWVKIENFEPRKVNLEILG